MSQRSGRGRSGPAQEPRAREREQRAPSGERPGLAVQIGLLIAVFAIVTAIAEVAGASSLGVAAAIGQIAFAVALVAVILRAP